MVVGYLAVSIMIGPRFEKADACAAGNGGFRERMDASGSDHRGRPAERASFKLPFKKRHRFRAEGVAKALCQSWSTALPRSSACLETLRLRWDTRLLVDADVVFLNHGLANRGRCLITEILIIAVALS